MADPKKVRKVVLVVTSIVFVVVVLIVAVLVFGKQVLALAGRSDCTAPAGYQSITNRMVTDTSGNPVYVIRGIYTTGEGTRGGKSVTLPPCGSNDSSIETINNFYIMLDGEKVILVAGSIGRDATPLQETPQP